MKLNGNKAGFQQLGRRIPGLEIPDFKRGYIWRGADLQTLRNSIIGPSLALAGDFERVSFYLGPGRILKAALHRSEKSHLRPLIILIHGLAGCETSSSIISAAAYFSHLEFPVLRLNLRGAGPSAQTSAGPYHGGLTEDLARVVELLSEREYGAGIILYGVSLGGNMMLKYLGEMGAETSVKAAIGISAPLRLKSVQKQIMAPRNRLYHNHLLRDMKIYARQLAATEKMPLRTELLDKAASARSLLEFDDQFVAPAHDMTGAEEYYRLHSAWGFVDKIKIPTLLIHARNDPWIPVADYQARNWPHDGPISLLITGDGGHVGFHGTGHKNPWHERVTAGYIFHLLDEGQCL